MNEGITCYEQDEDLCGDQSYAPLARTNWNTRLAASRPAGTAGETGLLKRVESAMEWMEDRAMRSSNEAAGAYWAAARHLKLALDADDIARAAAPQPLALAADLREALEITDAMCAAAVEADGKGNIQGFSYKTHYVIRDVSEPREAQEIWSAPVSDQAGYDAFQKQCRIERMRRVLAAALRVEAPQSTQDEGVRS